MSKSATEIEEDIDKALRKCRSLTAEGLWRRMRFLMEHDSDRRPYARHDGTPVTTTEQLSFATGCSVVKVSQVLPRLLASGLVKESPEGYYSPKIQRIIEVRASTARRVRKSRVLRNTQEGVTSAPCNTDVTLSPLPPPSPSPTPPTSTPSNPSLSPTGKACGRARTRGPRADRRKSSDHSAAFPVGVWQRAIDGFFRAYEHIHGVKPTPKGRDFAGLSDMLTDLGGDIDALANVVRAGLKEPERGPWQGHKLHVMAENLDYLRSKIAKGTVGHGNNHKPTAAERGECPEPTGRLGAVTFEPGVSRGGTNPPGRGAAGEGERRTA